MRHVVVVPPVPSTTSAFDVVYPAEPSRTSTGGNRAHEARTTASGAAVSEATTTSPEVQAAPAPTLPPRLPVVTDGEAFCEARLVREVDWPRTAAGTTVVMACPNNEDSQCLILTFQSLYVKGQSWLSVNNNNNNNKQAFQNAQLTD